MNHNPSSDDLSAALHGIADGVGSVPPSVADSDFATNVRLRTKVVRRRRRNQRIGIAAACLALVAVGGVVLVQNLPGRDGSPVPIATGPTQGTSFPECGSTPQLPGGNRPLSLVNEAHTDDAGRPLDQSAPDDKTWSTNLTTGGEIPLHLLNDSEDTLTVGSTGYASLVIVKNGVVVAGPGGMPEPYTSPTLQPGEMTPVSNTLPEPCNDGELPDGDYEAYALLDAQVSPGGAATGSDGEAEEALVYGGPWKIRLGETAVPPEAMSLECADEVSEIPRFIDPIRIDLTLPDSGSLDLAGGTGEDAGDANLRLNFRNTSDQTLHLQADRVETYLVSDGVVVASAATEEEIDLEISSGAAAPDGVLPNLPDTLCDQGDPVEAGEYQFFAIVNFTDADSGELVEAILGHEDITVIAPDPDESTSSDAVPAR